MRLPAAYIFQPAVGANEMENRHMGDYAKALGSKLRGIRQQQGLSLHGVEQKSGGKGADQINKGEQAADSKIGQ